MPLLSQIVLRNIIKSFDNEYSRVVIKNRPVTSGKSATSYVAMSATAISTIVIFKALGLVLNRQTHIGATGAPPGTKIPLTNHH